MTSTGTVGTALGTVTITAENREAVDQSIARLRARKPGLALALRLIADDLADLTAWLKDRYDYAEDTGKNAEAEHFHTVERATSELLKIARSIE